MVDEHVGRNARFHIRRPPTPIYNRLGWLVQTSSLVAGCSPQRTADIHQCVTMSQPYARPGLLLSPAQQQLINSCLNQRTAQHQADDMAAARPATMNAELAPLLQRANAGDLQAAMAVSAVYG